MAMEHVWDTNAVDSISEELAYFAALGFAVPVAVGRICALPLEYMLDWLLKPCGPPLVEGDQVNIHGHVPHRHLHYWPCQNFYMALEACLLTFQWWGSGWCSYHPM